MSQRATTSISASLNPSVRRALISARPAFDCANAARHLAWEACYNVRDVGGYPTGEGKPIRWQTLVRADNLYRLTNEGQAALREPHDVERAWRTEIKRRARFAHQHTVALAEDEQQPGLCGRNSAGLRSRCHPALQPALRDVEQEHQPVLATRAHIADVNLFRMRTIYVAAGNLSRRFWWYAPPSI